ncbi:MAG: CBS domain-containing protein [Planctomycetes bacterium]|nr:CBS domain-containing protein [Planctomycetota bacterium]
MLYDSPSESNIVSDFLTKDVVTVDEDDSLNDIAELFMSKPIRRLPVLRNEKVVGIISRRDLIRYILQIRVRVAQELEMRAKTRSA